MGAWEPADLAACVTSASVPYITLTSRPVSWRAGSRLRWQRCTGQASGRRRHHTV